MTEQMNVPKLRFSEFDGEWALQQLKSITQLITKGTTPKQFKSGQINFVKIESLVGTQIELERCITIDTDTHNKELKRSILQEHDILFAIAGATVGKVGIVGGNALPANTNQALAIIRLKDSSMLDFLVHVLLSRTMKNYIFQSVSVGAQPNLNLEQMGNFKYFTPQLPEQQKIASFLSKVDKKITLLTEKKDKLTEYKKGVMQQLFNGRIQFAVQHNQDTSLEPKSEKSGEQDSSQSSGKLIGQPNENSIFIPPTLRFKADDGSEFPDWEEKKLGEIVSKEKYSLTGGPFGSDLKSEDYTESGVRIIQLQNIGDGYFKNDYRIYTSVEKANSLKSCNIYPGDLLLSKMGDPVARALLVPGTEERYVMCSDGIRIVPNPSRFSSYFLMSYINSPFFRNRAFSVSTGSTRQRIGLTDLKVLTVVAPTIEEQTKIANFLSAIDQKIDLTNSELDKAKHWKKGLLQQMFV